MFAIPISPSPSTDFQAPTRMVVMWPQPVGDSSVWKLDLLRLM